MLKIYMKKIIFIAGMLILLLSCVNAKKMLENDKTDKIFFGRRGGFTNIPEEYVLFGNGQVCRIQNDSVKRIQRITRQKKNSIDSIMAAVNFNEIVLDEPGNMTYFIRAEKKEFRNEVKWSDSSANDAVSGLYATLISTLKNRR